MTATENVAGDDCQFIADKASTSPAEIAAYHASERTFTEEQLAIQTTRMWEITHHGGSQVFADRFLSSTYLGSKACNTIVHGQQIGDWLALSNEPGYIQMRSFIGKQFVRLMKDLIITLHVGPLGSHGFAEAVCTCMSGEELTEIQVSSTDPVGDVRAKIEVQLLNGDFHLMLPDGRVLSNDSIPIADLLGESWASSIEEGDLFVEEFLI